MADIQQEIWENSKSGEGVCSGCPAAENGYNHPGFFNYEANILIVEEAPSFAHFDFSGYDRSRDYEWYRSFYEEDHLDSILSWPPVKLFLRPTFEPLGFDDSEIIEEVYMTSSVKCPVKNRKFNEPFSSCRSYLEQEISEMDPELIITAGKLATEGTAELLGVSSTQIRDISISKPEWWGLSKFDTNPPLIHVPHWGYYDNHNRLTDEQWDECIQSVREGLLDTVYAD